MGMPRSAPLSSTSYSCHRNKISPAPWWCAGLTTNTAGHRSSHVQLCLVGAKQRKSWCMILEGEGTLLSPSMAELSQGQKKESRTAWSYTHISLMLTHGPSPHQCVLVAPAHSTSWNACPGPAATGCPLCPGFSPPALLLQSDTRQTGASGAVTQMPPWYCCPGSSCLLAQPHSGKGSVALLFPNSCFPQPLTQSIPASL